MLNGTDVALERLAQAAYLDQATGLPAGFIPMTQSALGLTTGATETFAGGIYTNQNAAALVAIGTLNGVTTLVLAFRGGDDRQDSIMGLVDINEAYPAFANLIAAVAGFAARQGIAQVVVTGHSLGGSMAQLYMQSHADNGVTHYLAETSGSPGALQPAGNDTRITNLEVADDPAVYLGLNRGAVGAQLQITPLLAFAAIFDGPEIFPGLTYLDVLGAIPSLTTDYVNRGAVALLPDDEGNYSTQKSLLDAASAGSSEHNIATYLERLMALTNSTGDDQGQAAITPTMTGIQVFRFFDPSNGSHVYVAGVTERDKTIGTVPDLTYEGIGLNAVDPATDPTAAAVFRFFDTRSNSDFLTASTAERDSLASGSAGMTYEGVAFYENLSPQAGDTAVYRFFDTVDGTHFYTPDQTEYASVLATRSDLVNEGIVFYTPKS